jgi:hypothetical protein
MDLGSIAVPSALQVSLAGSALLDKRIIHRFERRAPKTR